MNAVLRQVSRQLKYRELPALIGRRVVVTSAASACAEVHAQLHGSLPYGARFKGPESQYITRALAKYGILDPEFTVPGILWEPGDSLGLRLLEEFGFVVRDQLPAEQLGLLDDKDPTCLEQLREDIIEQRTVLKVFLNEQPKRDMKQYIAHLFSTGKAELLNGGSTGSLDPLLENYFPKTFEVADACLTNAEFIWFHKHFYM